MMRSQRCLSTRLASALQKTKEAICPCQALLQRDGCVQRRPARWRYCCDGCAQLLHKSLLETDVGICGEPLGRCAGQHPVVHIFIRQPANDRLETLVNSLPTQGARTEVLVWIITKEIFVLEVQVSMS